MLKKIFLPFLLLASAASATNGYDFAYSASGDPRLMPIQVFDDGKKTWIQLPRKSTQPAVFAVTPAGEVLISARPEDQFIVVDRVEQKFALVLGAARATVRYVGNAPRQNQAASFGATTPIRESGQVPAPVPAQEVLAARQAPPIPQATPATIPTGTAQTNAPPSAQAAADIEVKPLASDTPPAPESEKWDITLADQSIRSLLARWCKEANYQLLWEVAVDLEIGASATITGTFEDALTAVLSSISTSAYPVEAMIYDNRVVRVVKRNN